MQIDLPGLFPPLQIILLNSYIKVWAKNLSANTTGNSRINVKFNFLNIFTCKTVICKVQHK